MTDLVKIRRALISVSDKHGIGDCARALASMGVEILSTGGTYAVLSRDNIAVRTVDSYTGFPEIMDGRVKTLHPRIHGGLLAVRDNSEHLAAMEANDIQPIDLVIVNLYPFEKTIAREDVTLAEAIENIDIGGPAMLRSSAKNHAFVSVVVDPLDYSVLLSEMQNHDGCVTLATRRRLAFKAFSHTAQYDHAISHYLGTMFDQA